MDTNALRPVATGPAAAATPTERPQGALPKSERIDREAPAPEQADVSQPSNVDALTERPVPPSFSLSSTLTTYRDFESGRLVVRVSDADRGQVLVEFPPANSLHYAQKIVPASADSGATIKIKA